jgi:hypothetical protein
MGRGIKWQVVRTSFSKKKEKKKEKKNHTSQHEQILTQRRLFSTDSLPDPSCRSRRLQLQPSVGQEYMLEVFFFVKTPDLQHQCQGIRRG